MNDQVQITGEGAGSFRRLGHSVRGIANYILDLCDRLGFQHSNMGINKLTFFAYEALLLNRNVIVTNAKIEAWEHGPVFRELYQSFKSYGNGYILGRAKSFSAISSQFETAVAYLDEIDARIVDQALTPLIKLRASELRELSHEAGGAWHTVWWYDGHANPGMEISPAHLVAAHEGKLR